jgi:hypothetical protein
MTQVLHSASGEPWLLALFADIEAFTSGFKQLEANFIILFILFKKFHKVLSTPAGSLARSFHLESTGFASQEFSP